MHQEESSVMGPATGGADYGAAEAPRYWPGPHEQSGRLPATAQGGLGIAAWALWNCYMDLIHEVRSGLHALYESTVSEIRQSSTGGTGTPNQAREGENPGHTQFAAAACDDPLGEFGSSVRPNTSDISPN
jgi:hypothetical protein